MNISRVNAALSFGKTPILKCTVKESAANEKQNATLYMMNPLDSDDEKEVVYSKYTQAIYYDFLRAGEERLNDKDFYLLKNDKTGEVISCAQTSHHYRPEEAKHPGLSTLIEEIGVNLKYEKGEQPLFAGIAKQAQERYDNSIYTAFNQDTLPSLKQDMFTQTKLGEFYVPQRRFDVLINRAAKASQIEFLV